MNKFVKNTNENDYNQIEFDNVKVAEGYKKHKKFNNLNKIIKIST